MSRSGYVDDCETLGLYRHAVDRAIKGTRGQPFLREMAAAMDAMDERVLIEGELVNSEGDCCAIGTVCKARGTDLSKVDYDDPDSVGKAMGIAQSMAAEIVYINDECAKGFTLTNGLRCDETSESRWLRVRKWIDEQITQPASLITEDQ